MTSLMSLLVHVQSVADQSEDIEAPGLVHPVNIVGLSVAVSVLVVALVSMVSRSGLGGQEVEDEAEDAPSQDDRGTVGRDGEVDW